MAICVVVLACISPALVRLAVNRSYTCQNIIDGVLVVGQVSTLVVGTRVLTDNVERT